MTPLVAIDSATSKLKPSLEATYGPYASIDAAYAAIVEAFESGGIPVGYSLGFLKGGTTVAGKVTITDFKVNGVSIFSDLANYPFKVDEAASAYISGTKTDIIWAKTGDSLPTPIGGTVFEDVELNQNIELNARLFVGCPVQSGDMTNANYVVSRIGLHKSTITGTDSWDTPYQYIDPTVMKALGAGYKKMPKLKSITVIPTSEMTEMKDATVRFLLLKDYQ